jgi:hypothetical protein
VTSAGVGAVSADMGAANAAKGAVVLVASLLLLLVGAGCGSVDKSSRHRHPTEKTAVEIVVTGREPGGWPSPSCETAGALVEYYSSDGFSYDDELVLSPSRRGSLCWGRHPGARSGRVSFVVGTHTLDTLTAQLGLVYCDGESPKREQSVGTDTPVSSLAYYGPEVACGDSTAAERDDAFDQASELAARLVAAALRDRSHPVR